MENWINRVQKDAFSRNDNLYIFAVSIVNSGVWNCTTLKVAEITQKSFDLQNGRCVASFRPNSFTDLLVLYYTKEDLAWHSHFNDSEITVLTNRFD
jgi:hypothetical protein